MATSLPLWVSLLAWGFVFWTGRHEWMEGGGLRYGWIVLLVAPLVWWRNRPAGRVGTPGPGPSAAALAGLTLALLGWLPARWLLEANPEWRLPLWTLAAGAAGVAVAAHFLAGGWQLARPAALASLVLAGGLPWPVGFESLIRHEGAEVLCSAAAELLSALGQPAIARGNVLELARGPVGVDEACSGLHGIQNAFLAAVVLSALFGLRGRRLLAVFALAAGCALLSNLARVMILAVVHNAGGQAAFHAWHDSVGLAASAGPLAALLWGASRLARPIPLHPAGPPLVPARPLLIVALGLVVLGAAAAERLVARWYGDGPLTDQQVAPEIVWPRQGAHFTTLTLGADAISMLRCQRSAAARWTGAEGVRWTAYSLHWDAGRAAMQLARAHNPQNCFSMRGSRLVETAEPLLVSLADGRRLRFERFAFVPPESMPGQAAAVTHVFFARRSAGQDDAGTATNPWMWSERLRLAREGRRPSEQQVFEFALRGPRDLASATEAFEREIGALLR